MRPTRFLASGLGAALMLCVANGASAGCVDLFRFEAGARLSVVDFAGLKPPAASRGRSDRVILVQEFHPAARPTHDGWTALAVIYGTVSGEAFDTIGGMLWTRKPDAFPPGKMLTFPHSPDGEMVRIAPARRDPACPGGFVARIDGDGRMTAGGARIGVIDPSVGR